MVRPTSVTIGCLAVVRDYTSTHIITNHSGAVVRNHDHSGLTVRHTPHSAERRTSRAFHACLQSASVKTHRPGSGSPGRSAVVALPLGRAQNGSSWPPRRSRGVNALEPARNCHSLAQSHLTSPNLAHCWSPVHLRCSPPLVDCVHCAF